MPVHHRHIFRKRGPDRINVRCKRPTRWAFVVAEFNYHNGRVPWPLPIAMLGVRPPLWYNPVWLRQDLRYVAQAPPNHSTREGQGTKGGNDGRLRRRIGPSGSPALRPSPGAGVETATDVRFKSSIHGALSSCVAFASARVNHPSPCVGVPQGHPKKSPWRWRQNGEEATHGVPGRCDGQEPDGGGAAGPAKARAAALAPGSGRPAGSPARALGLAGRSDDGEGPRRSARSAAGRRGLHSHPSRGEGHTWTPSLFLHTLWPYLNQPESPALAAPANTSNPRRARFPISSTTVTTCNPSATSSAFSWKTLVEPT